MLEHINAAETVQSTSTPDVAEWFLRDRFGHRRKAPKILMIALLASLTFATGGASAEQVLV